jgi:hypothetical protein
MARVLGVLLAALVAWQAAPTNPRVVKRMADTWPYPGAPTYLRIDKTAGLEMTDTHWMHLHETGGAVPLAESVTWRLMAVTWNQNSYVSGTPGNMPAGAPSNFEVRYTVRGTPISAWMSFPASFTIDYDDPALDFLENGIHDIAIEARSDTDLPVTDELSFDVGAITGGATFDYGVQRSFLHFHRDGNTTSATVPIFDENHQPNTSRHGVVYVNVNDRNMSRNYNVRPDVTPWTAWPAQDQDLYQEALQPHTELFRVLQMWWEEPDGTADEGLKFVRPMAPKLHEFITLLYEGDGVAMSAQGEAGHRNFPVKDGPRGIGWSDGYVQGGGQSFDSSGNFYFVNVSGQLRVMEPNGELHTVAGWRVDPAKDPVWWLKSLNDIRVNMELRGNWPGNDSNVTELARSDPGFHQPMDVVKDKDSDTIFYVAGGYDHCIYKVTVNASTFEASEISVLAGLRGTSGHADATGTSARFWFPISITQHPSTGDLYVADLDNDAIRKVTLAGVVTTVYGHNDLMTRLDVIDSTKVQTGTAHPGTRDIAAPTSFTRTNAIHTVDSAAASGGTRPDFHLPWTIRFDSNNDLIVLDRGMDSIRRINLTTHVTTAIHNFTGGGFSFGDRGWQWMDVDRWGVIGPTDSILLAMAVSTGIPSEEITERFNEELHHIRSDAGHEGEGYYLVKGTDNATTPNGWGKVSFTDISHYPWLAAVDPRGAILTAGIGEHGITRIRRRRQDDPFIDESATAASGSGLAGTAYRESTYVWYAGQAFPWSFFSTMTDLTEYRPGTPPIHKFGFDATNIIGFNTAWQLVGNESDAELVSLFELPSDITATASVKANVLAFLRVNRGPETEAHYNRARIIVRRAN